MREFDNILDFTNHLSMVVMPNIPIALAEGLDEVGEQIVRSAKMKFGHYQRRVYRFPKWAPLAEATKENRVAQGFSEDEPLLRTGATRDSITYEIKDGDLVVGSTEPTMVYHEAGTKTEPPRPVLGPAMYEAKDMIRDVMGKATVLALVPGLKTAKLTGFRRTGPRMDSIRYDRYRR